MGREARIVRVSPPARVVRCESCGLTVRDPAALPDDQQDHYDASYYETYQMVDRPVSTSLAQSLSWVEGRLGQGRLLEVGCGLGYFLKHAKAQGWAVDGVEVSEWAAERARKTAGVDVRACSARALPFGDAHFQAVFAAHVLEHLEDPIGALGELRRVTQPGGILVVEVPNELAHLFVVAHRWYQPPSDEEGGLWSNTKRWLLNQSPEPPAPSSHLFFFSPSTLDAVVRNAGWRPVRLRTWRDHVDHSSAQLGGAFVKRAAYGLERCLDRGSTIEISALKPS